MSFSSTGFFLVLGFLVGLFSLPKFWTSAFLVFLGLFVMRVTTTYPLQSFFLAVAFLASTSSIVTSAWAACSYCPHRPSSSLGPDSFFVFSMFILGFVLLGFLVGILFGLLLLVVCSFLLSLGPYSIDFDLVPLLFFCALASAAACFLPF